MKTVKFNPRRRLRSAPIDALESRTLFSGSLDPTFGTGGYVTVPAANAGVSYNESVANVQTDGKLLVAAEISDGSVEAIRFLANGQLDPTFGSKGIAVLAKTGVPESIAETTAGKVVVLTNTAAAPTSHVFQLTSSGNPDTTFGHAGNIALPNGFYTDSMSVEGNQILLPGQSNSGTSAATEVGTLLRLNSNGTLDNTFGSAGMFSSNAYSVLADAIVTSTNEIAIETQANGEGAIILLHSNGKLDTSFANGGIYSSTGAIQLQAAGSNGALYVSAVVGTTPFQESTYQVSKLLADGAPDPTFTPFTILADANDFGSGLAVAVASDGSLRVDANLDPFSIAHYTANGKLVRTSVTLQNIADQSTQLLSLPTGGYIVFARPTLAYKVTSSDELDDTFGYYGSLAALTVPQPPFAYSAVATLSNRKVIAAGIGNNGVINVLDVYRYNVNGSLDTTFGTDGVVQTGFGELAAANASLLIQPDGKIVATVGIGLSTYYGGGQPTSFAVVRYNANGSLDNTFGKDGIVTVSGDGGIEGDLAPAVMWQDNKILVGTGMTLYRFNSNGTIDPSFAKGLPGGEAFAVQPDGKILSNAANYDSDSNQTVTSVTRYNVNGNVDKSFGTNGSVASIGNGEGIIADQILVETSGRIVLVDTLLAPVSGLSTIELVALNSDGATDNTFGSSGIVLPASLGTASATMLQQPDGQLLLAITLYKGYVAAGSPGGQYVDVSRYSATGQQDSSFGENGTAFVGTEFPIIFRQGVPLTVESVAALDTDGRLLLAGGNGPANANLFAIDTNNNTGTITGSMFYDTNGNGVRDPGEGPLNWTCYIDVDNDGHYDNADIRIYTDSAGNFVIPNLAPGVYHIRQSGVSHWQKTTPAEYTVTVTAGATVTGVDFGSRYTG